MKSRPFAAVVFSLALILPLLVAGLTTANDKKHKKSYCSNPHPEQLCNAVNTCGSASSPCQLDVKRTGEGSYAAVVPSIPNFPKDGLICIQAGTTVTWRSTSKNTGFMVDFGETSPFDPAGTISGGTDRPITVVTKRPGCFKYSVGACTPGSTYGMCGNSDFELIVTSSTN